MIGIFLWILMFMLLVILHELWHFFAAKKSGVKVEEFGIWMPPKVCTLWKDKSWTAYTLNWIPLGWFVTLKWEDWTDTSSRDSDTFRSAKLYKQLIIVVAGVVMNLITAFIIFSVIFSIGIRPITIIPDNISGISSQSYLTPSISFLEKEWFISENNKNQPLIIEWILSWSLAEQLGLATWEQISKINSQLVSPYTIGNILSKHTFATGNSLVIIGTNAQNTSEENSTKTLTFDCDKDCVLGVSYSAPEIIIKMPFHKAVLASLKEIKWEWNMTMKAFANIWSKLFSSEEGSGKAVLNQLTWPVGIIKFGEKLFDHNGILTFLWFGAMISLALAFFNILPIPAVDGGRFWTIILQHVFRAKRETFSKIEGWVNLVFFWALMLLWVIIILKDLVVWRGVSLPFIG